MTTITLMSLVELVFIKTTTTIFLHPDLFTQVVVVYTVEVDNKKEKRSN
jgi:hypothetical protein